MPLLAGELRGTSRLQGRVMGPLRAARASSPSPTKREEGSGSFRDVTQRPRVSGSPDDPRQEDEVRQPRQKHEACEPRKEFKR